VRFEIVYESSWRRKLRHLMARARGEFVKSPITGLRTGDAIRIHRYRSGHSVDAEFVVSKDMPNQISPAGAARRSRNVPPIRKIPSRNVHRPWRGEALMK
jgi:hypothetical protein